MTTPPPYLAMLYFGQGMSPIPPGIWSMFCDITTAQTMLKAAQQVCQNAVLVDVVHTPTNLLPPGVGPIPFGLFQTQVTTISVYVIYGTLPEGPQGSITGTITEYAGQLADDAQAPYGQLERELGGLNSQTPPNAQLVLAVYDSPNDQADPELYSRLAQVAP